MKTSWRSQLDAPEIGRAIFVDYEGRIDKPPVLLGWRIDGHTHAAIVDPPFAPCANRYRAKGILLQDHQSLVRRLVDQAAGEQRRVVGWSEHDLNQMRSVLSEGEQLLLDSVYRNAIKTVRPWYRRRYGVAVGHASLARFRELVGFDVPERYDQGFVGDGLRLIGEQLAAGRSWPELTDKARAAWVRIVKHNRLDLEGMEFVLRKATEV